MTLLELQRRMTADVSRPLTSDYSMQTRTDGGESIESIADSYIAPNAQLSSFERLEIYNRQYWFRTISAVAEDFPALQAVLGQKRFDALVLAYLHETPSTSWNLRNLSAKLPDFLSLHPVFAGRRRRLAIDVAQLEWAYIEAFDGGHRTVLSLQATQTLGPDSTLGLQPHLQLLALEYPVDDLVLAVHRQQPESEIVSSAALNRSAARRAALPPLARSRTFLAVHRFEDFVYYRHLDREWFTMLQQLRQGATLGAALHAAFARTKKTPQQQADSVQSCFAVAAELGWFVA